MPNGVSALASIAINEGRASRISDWVNYSERQRKPGEKGYRAPTPRGPHTWRASEAKARRGIARRRAMAKAGKMTHGAGMGVNWGNSRAKNGQFSSTEQIYGMPYSKIRAKRKGYVPRKSGEATKGWLGYTAPSHSEMAQRSAKTGEKLKRKRRA